MLQNLSKLKILSQNGSYEILFTKFDLENHSNKYYLVDSYFESRSLFPTKETIFVASTESNKSLGGVESVMVRLSELGMTKKDSLMVIGGGCIQDIGTLSAALYMRGIKWTFVPSTLAAMGDSCIGGKSSINAGQVKNLVGNFYPPEKVIIDTSLCKTLPKLEIVAGISEILKICFARSPKDFDDSVKLARTENLVEAPEILQELVSISLKAKKHFIEEDEFDTGIRKLLNFGHSFGHALESASNYRIPHGVAVMVGMIAAINHRESTQSKVTGNLKSICLSYLKMVSEEILKPLIEFDIGDFAIAISRDKKNSHESLVLVLPGPNGLFLYAGGFKQKSLEIAQVAMEKARSEVLNEIC